MICECKHAREGLCKRFPPVRIVEGGRNVWAWPPAAAECGEKASPDKVPAKGKNPASKRTRAASNAKSKAGADEA